MVKTRYVAKRQKTEGCTSYIHMESVMFNSDSLFKIASYVPAEGLLNLALTCRRFGMATTTNSDGDDSLSLIEETARRIVYDVATKEQKNALPGYDEDNWLSKYNYLQSLRIPLSFNQLVGPIGYVEGKKSRVIANDASDWDKWATAISNNIMMAGKHYVSFEVSEETDHDLLAGVIRPGEAMESAKGSPLSPRFYNHFTQRNGSRQYNNTANGCMYATVDGHCFSSDWGEGPGFHFDTQPWDGMEIASGSYTIGMLLDLDEGTLSVYKNDRKLGVMKRGLAGHYCWTVSLLGGGQVTIKRDTVPAS